MPTRRSLLLSLVGGVVALTTPAFAQKTVRIGFLGTGSAQGMKPWVDAFREEMRSLGYVEGRNLVVEYRWADGDYAKAPALAADLVRLKVDLIVTHGTPGTRAAKDATTTIPIIMATAGDAVLVGLVKSIARPGGNVTGSTFFNPELAAKRLELLKQGLPGLKRVGALTNSANPAMRPVLDAMEPAARALRMELHVFPVRSAAELESAFSAMAQGKVEATVIIEDGLFNAQNPQIAALAAGKRLPIIGMPELAEAGGLLAYGVGFTDMYRRAAVFADKILKGAKPGDLPIERPAKFELTVNVVTAKKLGVTFAPGFVERADRVIQ